MFTHWEVNCAKLARRVLFQRPAYYLPEQTLHVRERVFSDRKLRKRAPDNDVAAFDAKCNEICRLAAMNEAENSVSFAIGNSWNDTLRADKRHHLEYTTRSQSALSSPSSIFSGRIPRITSLLCSRTLFLFWSPSPLRWALFAPFETEYWLLFSGLSLSLFVHLGLPGHWCICPLTRQVYWGLILSGVCFELGVCSTCVSVRRRGRYTCTPNSFCVSCLVLLHAPPISVLILLCLPQVLRTVPLNCFVCAVLLLLVCHVLLWTRCPVGARVIVLSLCSCGLAVSLGFCAPRCACAGFGVSRVVCPPLFLLWFRSLSFLPPLPRGWSCVRPLPACTPVCWCLLLGICCICDGPVGLLHAWSVVKLCYPSVIRFMATKATRPVWGFHPLHHVTGDVGELSLAILRYSSC